MPTDYALDSFFNRQALQEYILLAGQHPAGGLRDKPPKYVLFFWYHSIHTCAHMACRNPDAYHTAYCISGLSAAQHHVYPSPARREEVRAAWNGEDGVRATAFAESLCWAEEDGGSYVVGSAANRIVSSCFFGDALVKEIPECYAPAIQFDGHTCRRNHGTFL
jgi:protein farnesyltransferase subunit beta